jgi:hypothetical protein
MPLMFSVKVAAESLLRAEPSHAADLGDSKYGRIPLSFVADKGHGDIAKLLLETGVSILTLIIRTASVHYHSQRDWGK